MAKTIFYSWQSDLPNNSNRTLIEECIKKAIKEIEKDVEYSLTMNIDRDTMNLSGSPDIANSILSKIDRSSFFIADISITNGKSRKYRKSPNPNVLFELGYAVHKLGWDRVICLFNLEFGKLSDLPFDLRNRRIISYNTTSNRLENKKLLASKLSSIIKANYRNQIVSNELMDYYNVGIYTELLRIVGDFSKIIYGYEVANSLENLKNVFSLKKDVLEDALRSGTFLGFSILKSYEVVIRNISQILEKIVPLNRNNDDFYIPIIRVIRTLTLYDKELNRRGDLSKFTQVNKTISNYRIMKGEDKSGRLILLKRINDEQSQVVDFGDFIRKDHIENLLTQYKLNDDSLKFYTGFICEVLEFINDFIDKNDGEFFLDESKLEFSFRKK